MSRPLPSSFITFDRKFRFCCLYAQAGHIPSRSRSGQSWAFFFPFSLCFQLELNFYCFRQINFPFTYILLKEMSLLVTLLRWRNVHVLCPMALAIAEMGTDRRRAPIEWTSRRFPLWVWLLFSGFFVSSLVSLFFLIVFHISAATNSPFWYFSTTNWVWVLRFGVDWP